MTDVQRIAADYVASWNATDPEARRAAIAALYAPDGRYVDPHADVRGHDEIDALVAGVQQRFPGLRFRLLGPVDAHHDVVRFGWELGPEGEDAPIAGSDVVTAGSDGRLTAVHGFLDRVPG